MQSIFMFEQHNRPNIIDHSMQCGIESENCILVSELVRKYSFGHNFQLERIFEELRVIKPAIVDIILLSVKTHILKNIPHMPKNAIFLSLCSGCGQENCLVIIVSYNGQVKITDRIPNEILGFKLLLYDFLQPCEEAMCVFKSVPDSISRKQIPLPRVTEGEARELFQKHSNLTMISASQCKSIGYRKGKHKILKETCINLFCIHKGYIPFREEHFPKQIGDFVVDVLEGCSVFGAGASLEIGGYICRSGCGSIGGFVDLPNNRTGLITCAHVIFSSNELEELESMNGIPPGIEVKAFDRTTHTYKVCGVCAAAEFPKCLKQEIPPHPNVDAALIELDPVIDTFRLRTVSSDQLNSAGNV
jgi:hypothetical protein